MGPDYFERRKPRDDDRYIAQRTIKYVRNGTKLSRDAAYPFRNVNR